MQGTDKSIIPQWLFSLLANLATFIALGTGWYKERQNRKRLEADIKLQSSQGGLLSAQEKLTEVQTESAQLQNRKTLAEMLDGCYVRIDGLEEKVDVLMARNKVLVEQANKVPHLEDTIKLNEKMISDMECVLSLRGINLGDELDKLKGVK
jgi:uncharacterized protein YaaW (UPF0174 family)